MFAGDEFGVSILFIVLVHVLWTFGIHGNNALDRVAQTLFVPALALNTAAAVSGQIPTNVVTKTMIDVFVLMGGSGATLALLIALLLFSSGRGYRSLYRYALPSALFNINEPVIFGMPIVLNPVFAIPFVITPLAMLLISFGSIKLGLVPHTIADVHWATPIFFSGYIATGSPAGSILQFVNLSLGVFIYMPFVKLSEKLGQLRFEQAFQDMVTVVTTDYAPETRQLIRRTDEIGAVARQLSNHLEQALRANEMFLKYQPIVDSSTNKMHSVEALLRWKHPQWGMISPMVIVALSEETGSIRRLGMWVMEESLKQMSKWRQEGLDGFIMSVNVSSRQLDSPSFHKEVLALLEEYKIPPTQLQLEITEAAALIDNESTRENLSMLKQYGVSLAMDDFGAGHSSLLYLRTQPISTLKIDASLSREVVHQPANLEIIATIFDLCRLLGIDTVIEFVDNAEQLSKLKSIGITLIQGYLYSPPLPGDKIPGYIKGLNRKELTT
jgi:EAL domain-containing protein (putative c-di-GMP-specific phosphodiesterase class I)